MAGGVSIHVVDVTRGLPAAGMRVEVFRLDSGRARIGGGALETTSAAGFADGIALTSNRAQLPR